MTRQPALVLLPQPAWPLDDGGRVGLWQITWSMARFYDTTILMMLPPGREAGPTPPELLALGARVVAVPHVPPRGILAVWKGLAGPWPYTLARYRSAAFSAAVARAVAEVRPRVAMVNHLHLATYADNLGTTPFVLRQHNVESVWLERYSGTLRGPARWYARGQAARMRTAEARLCERADLVLAIHPEEAAAIRALAPRARVEIVPVGVDFARFQDPRPGLPPVVLLTGSFRWPPNAEGARRFLLQGWPRVLDRVPDARLRLVGKGLEGTLVAQARRSGAEPVGYVDDIAPEFAAATAVVVPLWTGAGMRVKIVEAMAARVPVVATPVAAEGLGIERGVHFECADDAEELGCRVADLLCDPERARALAGAAHAYGVGRYSLERVAGLTAQLCESVVGARRGPGGEETGD